jgi:hypothetical protein
MRCILWRDDDESLGELDGGGGRYKDTVLPAVGVLYFSSFRLPRTLLPLLLVHDEIYQEISSPVWGFGRCPGVSGYPRRS